MVVRRRALPMGWYLSEPEAIKQTVSTWLDGIEAGGSAPAVLAPHAGWAFSGHIAAKALAQLREAETIAIIGGHLPARHDPLAAREEAFQSPFGLVPADLELLDALESELSARDIRLGSDDEPDNTVEVQLPLVACLFPRARVLWLRAPNGASAIEVGRALNAAASKIGRSVSCVGSTDLTHYGPNYGFSPAGRGPEAAVWVRETNDRRFIDALLALDIPRALKLGETERSACSAGAAAAVLAFAIASGPVEARLLGYATSLEVRKDESFVGYAAIALYSRM